MLRVERIGAAGATLANATLLVGARASVDELERVAASARHDVIGELFRINEDDALAHILRDQSLRIPVRIHGDTESMTDAIGFGVGRADDRVQLTGHGAPPVKLHTKTIVADGERAVISTAGPAGELAATDTLDLAVRLGGREARAVAELAQSARSGDGARISAAADDAARLGIFSNDPAHGVRLLRERVDGMLDRARDEVLVATKRLGDPELGPRLVAARERGAHVMVVTSAKAETKHVERLRRQGIDVRHLPAADDARFAGRRLHGNIVIADGDAYVGNAMHSRRGMARAGVERQSRELGWVTDDPAQVAALRDAVAGLAGLRTSTMQ